jgi:ubiquinone/menaquinone biosynthesis C-methylase UbiE
MAETNCGSMRAMPTSVQYHLSEFQIAVTPGDPRRSLPQLPVGIRSILDVGCGVGQTLAALNLPLEVRQVGVDIDDEALDYGRAYFPNIKFHHATGDDLPFSNGEFDAIICRVSIMFMNIPKALDEFARVLKPAGYLWVTTHPLSTALSQAWYRHFNLGRMRILTNGLALHCLGTPLWPAKETWQSRSAMVRLLRKRAFENITFTAPNIFEAIRST